MKPVRSLCIVNESKGGTPMDTHFAARLSAGRKSHGLTQQHADRSGARVRHQAFSGHSS